MTPPNAKPELLGKAVQCRSQPNPPWADRIIEANLDLFREIAGDNLLPMETYAQRRAGVREWREFGACGAWGCVYPTRTPGIVLKLTTDKSEAAFIAAALELGEWPDGIVRYVGVYELDQRVHEPRFVVAGNRAYAIWREEAFLIGEQKLCRLIGTIRNVATRVRSLLEDVDARELPAFLADVQRELPWAREQTGETCLDWQAKPSRVREQSFAQNVALFVAEAACYAQRLAEEPTYGPVGEALLFYIERGLLMADVHNKNIGTVHRNGRSLLAITDPGQMVPVHPKYTAVAVPRLTRTMVANRDVDPEFGRVYGACPQGQYLDETGKCETIRLLYAPERYFLQPADAQQIPLERLHTTRARVKGIANAEKFMHASYRGMYPKRAPITVKRRPDGDYDVVDGNSTTAIARKHGWPDITATFL